LVDNLVYNQIANIFQPDNLTKFMFIFIFIFESKQVKNITTCINISSSYKNKIWQHYKTTKKINTQNRLVQFVQVISNEFKNITICITKLDYQICTRR